MTETASVSEATAIVRVFALVMARALAEPEVVAALRAALAVPAHAPAVRAPDALVSKADAARAIDVSVTTLDRFVREGAPVQHVGARRKFDLAALRAWLALRGQRPAVVPAADVDPIDITMIAARAGLRRAPPAMRSAAQ